MEIINASSFLFACEFSRICYCSQIKILYMNFYNFIFPQLHFKTLPNIVSLGRVGSPCRTIAGCSKPLSINASLGVSFSWGAVNMNVSLGSGPGSRDAVHQFSARALPAFSAALGAPCAALAAALPPCSTSGSCADRGGGAAEISSVVLWQNHSS